MPTERREGDVLRRTRRARNDARFAAHRSWQLRLAAMESQMRLRELGDLNRAIVARLDGRR